MKNSLNNNGNINKSITINIDMALLPFLCRFPDLLTAYIFALLVIDNLSRCYHSLANMIFFNYHAFSLLAEIVRDIASKE